MSHNPSIDDLPDHYRRQVRDQLRADRHEDAYVPGEPTKADAVAERELQQLCEQYLRRNEIEFLHLSPRAREKAGWPDLTMTVNGIPIAVELKTQTGKLSADQERVAKGMAANGWNFHVVRSFCAFRTIIDAAQDNGSEG